MQKKIHIGTSGWSYKHWRGTFYPDHLKHKEEFAYYLQRFDTVEINNTFYKLPKEAVFETWEQLAPPGFTYAVKARRYITHMKKLHNPEESVRLFLLHTVLLNKKLGPVLFQLPPFLKANVNLLSEFLKVLPKENRYVFEFRNTDWYREEVYELLRTYNCCFCIYELDGHVTPLVRTANFIYIRLHGPGNKYQGSYPEESLQLWAERCKEWAATGLVFVYFDNDEMGYAAFNALRLKELVA